MVHKARGYWTNSPEALIDSAVQLIFSQTRKGLSTPIELNQNILNRSSGLLGISGKYMDRRDILKAMKAGEKRAKLSFEIECYRLRKYIGAYAAALGRVDAIVFTAGVGENSFPHRLKICEGLGFLGVKIDGSKNKRAVGGEKEMEINSPDSPVKVFVIPTDEELMFAKEVFAILKGRYDTLYQA